MDSLSKKDLRRYYKKERKSLSDERLKHYNQLLLEQFKKFPFQEMHFIHFFLPITRFNEPDTYPIIHWLKVNHPESKAVVSRSNFETHLMESLVWEGSENLQPNKWGIDEPLIGKKVLSQQLDAVIVPLLAYDIEGHRVGYGQGFYDRFLLECRKDCQKIGLSFFDPVQKIIDADQYDVKLDYCITPNRRWKF